LAGVAWLAAPFLKKRLLKIGLVFSGGCNALLFNPQKKEK